MKKLLVAILFYAISAFFFVWGLYFAFATNNVLAIVVCCVISAIAYRTPKEMEQQRHGAEGEK